MTARCDACRFGHIANPTTIQCRRYAPRPVQVDLKMTYPTVPLDFWCGEFEAKVGAPARAPRKGH